MNHNKHIYKVTFQANGTAPVVQTVQGIDLRDAASRFLTSEQGMILAKGHQISADIIHEFPGNFDSQITVSENDWSVHVALVDKESQFPSIIKD